MNKKYIAAVLTSAALSLSFALPALAYSVSCAGTPSATAINWTSSTSGAVAPVTYLWGNGNTASTQSVTVAPGTYSMTLQTTDASSTVATTTCSSTVGIPAPTITMFQASPSSIMSGHSSTLSWTVANASSTSINQGVGTVTGSSVSVSPSVTTTYTLTAMSPAGTVTSAATVTVTASSTGSGISSQVQALLSQIAALKAQLAALVGNNSGGNSSGNGTTTATGGNCFAFGRDIGEGKRGDDVKALQKLLAKDPSIFASSSATGVFGPKTRDGLKKFQKKFGLAPTGFFGPRTREFTINKCSSMGDRDGDGISNFFEHHEGRMGTSTIPFPGGHADQSHGPDDSHKGKGMGHSHSEGSNH